MNVFVLSLFLARGVLSSLCISCHHQCLWNHCSKLEQNMAEMWLRWPSTDIQDGHPCIILPEPT